VAIHSLPSAGEETGDDIVAEINITPLTDIFLVLLIIFMVTTSVNILDIAQQAGATGIALATKPPGPSDKH